MASAPNQRALVSSVEQGQQASRAVTVCSEVLKSDPENANALKDRAEAYVQEEQYEEGKLQGSWRVTLVLLGDAVFQNNLFVMLEIALASSSRTVTAPMSRLLRRPLLSTLPDCCLTKCEGGFFSGKVQKLTEFEDKF